MIDFESQELYRQQSTLELIASENYASPAVLAACASIFANKYSEWYPGARYYGWQEVVDRMELATQQAALQIFGLDQTRCVNVQPLSWSVANAAVYLWILKPWDTVLAMDLACGGHLSHGSSINISWIIYNFVWYWVDNDGIIDYQSIDTLIDLHNPRMIIRWYSSYPRDIDRKKVWDIKSRNPDIIMMADIAHFAGLVAWWVLWNPFGVCDIVTTTTHKTLRGPRGALIYSHHKYSKQVNRWVFPGIQWWPQMNMVYAKYIAFHEILSNDRKKYTQTIINNAQILSQEIMNHGRNLVTHGTSNHLMVLDVHEIWGMLAQQRLEDIWLSANKNVIPYDTRTPKDPSGLRIGTPAITTRGLTASDMPPLARAINVALRNENTLKAREIITTLCTNYPLPYGPQ